MRQAGRCLPEYRELRRGVGMLDLCRSPELAAEATLQPVRRLGVDAAILFSDIMLPLAGVGVRLRIEPGTGPVIDSPVRSAAAVRRLRPLEPAEDVPFVAETVRILVGELAVPLIGFAGAPFTLASYLVEGGPSRSMTCTRALMYGEEATWHELLDRLADISLASLRAQVEAGVAAVQLFDSWVGILAAREYERFVMPATRRIFEGLADLGVPRVHFGVGTGELLELMSEAGADAVGIDWRVPLSRARARLGEGVALQGNLDPAACLGGWDVTEREVRNVLREAGDSPGHVFNLGHGVLPETDPDTLARIVELVHEAPAGGGRGEGHDAAEHG